MSIQPFQGSFTQQEAIPEESINAAIAVMQSGRLHRYNTENNHDSEAAMLEREFAEYMDMPYCLACASGGYALHLALAAAGLERDEIVLTNAFTLSPVPGSIRNAGGKPVLVETTENLVMNLDHLVQCIESTGARFLMLSHMRGNIVDMDQLMEIVDTHDIMLVEDCAHTMGASWNGKKSGSFGAISCFSTQTYKHLNSGEGGLLLTRDADVMARASIMSGSYMLYQRHGTPPPESAFKDARLDMPNCSGRMDNLRASILRPQLKNLDANCARWNKLYRTMATALAQHPDVCLPERSDQEQYVASSFQFRLPWASSDVCTKLVALASEYNVELKWFGATAPTGFTSNHTSWRYLDTQNLPETDRILEGLFDLRLPLTFTGEDCECIAKIIRHCVDQIKGRASTE